MRFQDFDIVFAQKPPLNAHTELSSRARGLTVGLNLPPLPYIVYVRRSEGSGEGIYGQAPQSHCCL